MARYFDLSLHCSIDMARAHTIFFASAEAPLIRRAFEQRVASYDAMPAMCQGTLHAPLPFVMGPTTISATKNNTWAPRVFSRHAHLPPASSASARHGHTRANGRHTIA